MCNFVVQKESQMLKTFFEQLAGYYRAENDLSNIVVALCNAHQEFKEKFVKFFFPHLNVNHIESILREVPDKNHLGSRVDIYITTTKDTKPYIIEVKIGDRSHHFGQYEEAYEIGKDRFGYITNYECIEGKEQGYEVKTWEGFYDELNESEDEIIKAFAVYLKNVCGIIKYDKPMNITGLDAIPCFADTIRRIISKERNWVETPFYKEYARRDSIHVGFTINFPKSATDGFARYGLWFFQEKPLITICLTDNLRLSEQIMNDRENVIENTWIAKQPYQEDEKIWEANEVWFELSDEKLQDFINAPSYEEQQRIVEAFFDEVIRSIQKYF